MRGKHSAKTMEDHLLRRIFRSILLVTVFDMVGWASTQSIVTILAFVDLPGFCCCFFVDVANSWPHQ